MSDQRLALHARFPEGPTDADVAAAYDKGAASVGMVFHGVERQERIVTRLYGELGGPSINFSYTLNPPCQLLMMGPFVDRPGPRGREDPTSYTHARIAEVFTQACAHLDAYLGRSDGGPGCGFVQDGEIDGPLEFIDWYQYLGPRVVERLGRGLVLSAPAFRITEDGRGAVVMLLASGPWDDFSRRAVAAHLRVTLRPLYGRNPATGERVIIPWR